MPDIRNFFGGKGSQGADSSQDKAGHRKDDAVGALKRKRTNLKSAEDQAGANTTKEKKSSAQKRTKRASPAGEETTTTEYFEASSKSKTNKPASKVSVLVKKNVDDETTPTRRSPRKATSTADKKVEATTPVTTRRTTPRAKKPAAYVELGDSEDDAFHDEAKDADDDIHAAEFKSRKRKHGSDYAEEEAKEDDAFEPAPAASKAGKANPAADARRMPAVDVEMADVDAGVGNARKTSPSKPAKGRELPTKKRDNKSTALPSAEREESQEAAHDDVTKKAPSKRAQSSPKKVRAPTKKAIIVDSKEIQDILGSIPKVPLPEAGPASTEPKKFNYQSHAGHTAPPPAAGTKELPTGAENCLAGLSFVFTGVLETLGREDGQELVKRHGGKITTAPSSKTSYVVLGSDAGPKKIETIRKNNITTINEDGLFELIRKLPANGGDSKAAAQHEEKRQKEEQKIKETAADMERQERKLASVPPGKQSSASHSTAHGSKAKVDDRLWTVKYAPSAMTQICGNKGQVEKLQRWLREWPKSQRIHFKKAGIDGSFCYRAILIHGPPGIGKTTAAHLVARLEGYDVVESNASDTRSKKLVETGLRGVLDGTSLLGYFASDQAKVEAGKKKLVLIMDEVDGMSAGDRGGVGALAAVCKKTNIPMILICNERRLPKLRPFDHVTYDLAFRRPTTQDIRSRIASICYREGLKLPTPVIDALIEGSHADIRQIINMISAARLDQEAMSFDEGKSMSKAWEKHVILKPWDIVNKILSPAMFGSTSNKTLNDKIELYFNDHEFSYLMLQENYLKTTPSIANSYTGKGRTLKCLELFDKAAEAISDGDLVDRMIHGPQQHWSLMPTHAVFSTVRPASYVYGNLGGQASFTSWLGNNSKQGKLSRFVKEIQGHMRLRSSGDRHEIRQQYLPALWYQMIRRLQVQGKEAVEPVIELMDSYFLTRDDFDAIVELGLGPMDIEKVKIDSQAKATFTRLYNQQSHPLPFMKSSAVAPPKKVAREKPDLEEAMDESDDGEEPVPEKGVNDGDDDEADMDLSKDKYVKQPKKKAAARKAPAKKAPANKATANKAPAKRKSKGKKVTKEEEEEEEKEEEAEEVSGESIEVR
ncbi:MAG: hypothetical protein M1826_002015 [Phylliscum demangeonii]|nr:MAG: hypothetical protein M1826_002015 [Phylliscum demangeonii]